MADHWTYRFEYVRCGKKSCKSCPHGPYWYRYRREGPKVRKEYVGKRRPADAGQAAADPAGRHWDAYDEVLAAGGLTLLNAFAVLGLPNGADGPTARLHYRRLCLEFHPDRGGDARKMKALNVSWEYLCNYYGWHRSR